MAVLRVLTKKNDHDHDCKSKAADWIGGANVFWQTDMETTTTLHLINVIRSTSTARDILHGDAQNWNVSSLQKLQSSVCVPENCALKGFCFPE